MTTIEVVIPSLRQEAVERLVLSLCLGTVVPTVVTVVSNEAQPFAVPPGSRVRLLRFESQDYCIGELDVALRQNVGLFTTECDLIVIQGDDQIAPPTMIADTIEGMEGKEYLWGNHRLIDFRGMTLEEIMALPMERGASRENPVPPARHGYWSCYGGMFAAQTSLIHEVGGFDMAFLGRHAREDQQLGYRLMKRAGESGVLIEEPPFSWHPIELRQGNVREHLPWLPAITNSCGDHQWSEVLIGGIKFVRCTVCPAQRFGDAEERLFRGEVIIPYRPDWVQTTSVWL